MTRGSVLVSMLLLNARRNIFVALICLRRSMKLVALQVISFLKFERSRQWWLSACRCSVIVTRLSRNLRVRIFIPEVMLEVHLMLAVGLHHRQLIGRHHWNPWNFITRRALGGRCRLCCSRCCRFSVSHSVRHAVCLLGNSISLLWNLLSVLMLIRSSISFLRHAVCLLRCSIGLLRHAVSLLCRPLLVSIVDFRRRWRHVKFFFAAHSAPRKEPARDPLDE